MDVYLCALTQVWATKEEGEAAAQKMTAQVCIYICA